MKSYIRMFLKYKFILFFLAFISVLSSVFSIISIYFSGLFIDTIIEATSSNEIFLMAFIFFGVLFFNIILNFFAGYIYSPFKEKMVYEFKKTILENSQTLNKKYEKSYIAKRVDEDSRQVTTFILENYSTVFIKLIELFVVGFLIFQVDSTVGFIALIVCPLYFLLYIFFRKSLFRSSLGIRESSSIFFSDYTNKFDEVPNGVNIENSFVGYYKSFKTYIFINTFLNSSQSLIVAIMQVTIFIIGGVSVLNGYTTIGLLSITMSYFNQLINNISYYMQLAKRYKIVQASIERISEFISD